MRPSFRPTASALLLILSAACGDAGTAPAVAADEPAASCGPTATVDLAVGQTLPLTAEQAACFRLAPHAGARYALAAFDARSVEAARGGPEPAPSADPSYRVGDGAAGGPAFSRSAVPSSPAARPEPGFGPRRAAVPADADPFRRATPWKAGDRFEVERKEGGAAATARVLKVLGGRYVFALVDDDATGHADRFVADTEKAMEFVLREGLPLLETAYGTGAAPVTSDGSGQLLVLLSAWNPDQGAGGATSYVPAGGSGIYSYLWLNLDVRPGVREGFEMFDFASYRLKVLAHELAHAWQVRWLYATRGAGRAELPYSAVWAMEGSADLVALDLVRRHLGIGLTENWDWNAKLQTENRFVTYALEPADTRGRLARGYFDASSFLRDLQVRLVRRGMSPDAALAEVARGAVEGWHGIDGLGIRRRGLADRMRGALGAGWDPADAVLLWTLAQALDESTPNPALDNAVYADAGDPDARYSWKAAAPDVQVGRGAAREFTHTAGGSFFLRLKDDGQGGEVSARSSAPGARWMIARSR